MMEQLGRMLIPLIVDYAAGKIEAPYKRILFLNVSLLKSEATAALIKTETGLDDKLLASIIDEAQQEFEATGFPLSVVELDAWVSFGGE